MVVQYVRTEGWLGSTYIPACLILEYVVVARARVCACTVVNVHRYTSTCSGRPIDPTMRRPRSTLWDLRTDTSRRCRCMPCICQHQQSPIRAYCTAPRILCMHGGAAREWNNGRRSSRAHACMPGPAPGRKGDIFVFWSLLKTFFTKRPTPKHLLKIDHF